MALTMVTATAVAAGGKSLLIPSGEGRSVQLHVQMLEKGGTEKKIPGSFPRAYVGHIPLLSGGSPSLPSQDRWTPHIPAGSCVSDFTEG